jgi:hypothetical protein
MVYLMPLYMPLYIVRWPNLSAAIVRAENHDHLLDILDEEGNAEGCKIEEYDGPLYVDFELPVDYEVKEPEGHQGPLAPEHITVKDAEKLLTTPHGMVVTAPNCDTGAEMCEAVMRFAFPHVFKEWSKGDEKNAAERLEKAAHQDALELVRADWRREHTKRATDPASRLAAEMDMPVRLAEQYVRAGQEDAGRPSDPPPKPKRRPGGNR